jgi:hypothetical protein
MLTRNITRWGCDLTRHATSVETCRHLNGQARELAAEIEGLKARAGALWTSEKQVAAEAGAKKASPLPPRSYTFRQRADPSASYRTVCVRLCDGFYFPVSEAVQLQGFLADEQRCQSSCGAAVKLFYQAPFAEDTTGMVALTGERYEELLNAYRYRTEYVGACACKPKPWSREAKVEYHRRAVVAGRTKEERTVAAGADEVAKMLAVNVAIADASASSANYANAGTTRLKLRRPRYSLVDPQKAAQPPKRPILRFLFKRQNASNQALTVGEPAPRSRRSATR